ncbi:hypothetical protein AR158_c333R [Paramecium bursaria Chlorella virus AR158]|uniref:hypothetical protein n=1 Tax=Paramecium bursaria Chlorella virus AR158 TaxID=380598 RepID=UPI00015AA938|nr:hypothetical protein AR158_c333R [Paramecium bursaria Chlorella virus AR158]ABU43878.1 hypothetical protein AR158_c333R [Paramecium bursaria Chlorella virus AR158]
MTHLLISNVSNQHSKIVSSSFDDGYTTFISYFAYCATSRTLSRTFLRSLRNFSNDVERHRLNMYRIFQNNLKLIKRRYG